ncbi:hypothetical protein [Streptomyces sp. NPDC005012]|uniref:hypothetical protein n=1 Tax=Streptomyces sp. NPDC005012 TaxID=3154558 RepID=UPI0033B17C94
MPGDRVGGPKVAARQGVVSALRSNPHPHPGDGRHPIAWLHICTPYGAAPTAHSSCACGRDLRAFGVRQVLALAADHGQHRTTCPLRTDQEGRAAA